MVSNWHEQDKDSLFGCYSGSYGDVIEFIHHEGGGKNIQRI